MLCDENSEICPRLLLLRFERTGASSTLSFDRGTTLQENCIIVAIILVREPQDRIRWSRNTRSKRVSHRPVLERWRQRSNRRVPLENRARFPLQVVDAVAAAIGAERVGIRLSPFTDYGDSRTSDPMELGTYMAKELSKRNLAYVHYIEPRMRSDGTVHPDESLWPFRKAFTGGAFLAAGGYNRGDGIEAVKSGKADAIVFGRLFLANPDLPRRYLLNAPSNPYNRDAFYTPDPIVGYTDYPFLE